MAPFNEAGLYSYLSLIKHYYVVRLKCVDSRQIIDEDWEVQKADKLQL